MYRRSMLLYKLLPLMINIASLIIMGVSELIICIGSLFMIGGDVTKLVLPSFIAYAATFLEIGIQKSFYTEHTKKKYYVTHMVGLILCATGIIMQAEIPSTLQDNIIVNIVTHIVFLILLVFMVVFTIFETYNVYASHLPKRQILVDISTSDMN